MGLQINFTGKINIIWPILPVTVYSLTPSQGNLRIAIYLQIFQNTFLKSIFLINSEKKYFEKFEGKLQ